MDLKNETIQNPKMLRYLSRDLKNEEIEFLIFIPILILFLRVDLPIWIFPFLAYPLIKKIFKDFFNFGKK